MSKPSTIENNKITVIAPLRSEKASLASVVEALQLPTEDARQPDLQYLTAILVSSGMNKNGAVFLGSELLKARGSILHKAMDFEHEDKSVVGHITNHVFLRHDGTFLDAGEIEKSTTIQDLDVMDMDIAISAIVHKARFPELSKEILDGGWMVSMEAFYRDYDIKVGDLIIPREQAAQLGYDQLVGTVVKVKDGEKEVGYHLVGRVLRDIVFAGVGLVKNPANERSVILEAAAIKDLIESNKESASVINLADIRTIEVAKENNEEDVTDIIRQVISEEMAKLSGEVKQELSGLLRNHVRPGTCVHFKRYLVKYPEDALDSPPPSGDTSQYSLYTNPDRDSFPPGTEIVGEFGCNLFGIECSARPGDATSPRCWRNVFARTVRDELTNGEDILRSIRESDRDLVRLQDLIDEARKFKQ